MASGTTTIMKAPRAPNPEPRAAAPLVSIDEGTAEPAPVLLAAAVGEEPEVLLAPEQCQ